MALLSQSQESRGKTQYPNPFSESGRCMVFSPVFVLCVAFVTLASCSEKSAPPTSRNVPPISGPVGVPATNVLGVTPAAPTNDSSASTSPAKTDMSAAQQSSAMPMPGQANDHSVLEPKPSQKPASR